MKLSKYGEIVDSQWLKIADNFSNITLDEYVIMPNHIHGIIGFDGQPESVYTGKSTDVSNVVKRFKQETVRLFKGECGFAPTRDTSFWQKSFYDHIIRNQEDLVRIKRCIRDNPAK